MALAFILQEEKKERLSQSDNCRIKAMTNRLTEKSQRGKVLECFDGAQIARKEKL